MYKLRTCTAYAARPESRLARTNPPCFSHNRIRIHSNPPKNTPHNIIIVMIVIIPFSSPYKNLAMQSFHSYAQSESKGHSPVGRFGRVVAVRAASFLPDVIHILSAQLMLAAEAVKLMLMLMLMMMLLHGAR